MLKISLILFLILGNCSKPLLTNNLLIYENCVQMLSVFFFSSETFFSLKLQICSLNYCFISSLFIFSGCDSSTDALLSSDNYILFVVFP